MPHLLSKNKYGRIYVKKFLVEKLIYKTILSQYPELKVSWIKYDDTHLSVYLKEISDLNDKKIEFVISELTNILKDNYGIYIEGVNIEISK